MATGESPYNSPPSEDDYIDMEVLSSSSSSNTLCYSLGSSPESRDFEFQFQMTSFSGQTEPATSPADELFYKGKLLPLHLPPRLQMVQKLLQSSNNGVAREESFSEKFQNIPFAAIRAPPESCNTSPTESCRPSCDLNPDTALFGWRAEINGFSQDPPPSRKLWSKKLKQIKQSSRVCLKALFGKSGCSDKLFSLPKNPFEKTDYNRWEMPNAALDGGIKNHRRSFSGAIQRAKSSCSSNSSSGSSSLSSSFSFSSNGLCDLKLFKRSISSNCEIESSIEGAIAHCKQSQKLFGSKVEEICSI